MAKSSISGHAQGGNPSATLLKLTQPQTPKKAVATSKQKQINQASQPTKTATTKSDVAQQSTNKDVKTEIKSSDSNTSKAKKSNTSTASVNVPQKKVSPAEVTGKNKQIEQKQTSKSVNVSQKKFHRRKLLVKISKLNTDKLLFLPHLL